MRAAISYSKSLFEFFLEPFGFALILRTGGYGFGLGLRLGFRFGFGFGVMAAPQEERTWPL